jgi:hypothetical protein
MLGAGYWIFMIAHTVTSKNIQQPGASIQDQLTRATVFVVATRMKCNVLCSYRDNYQKKSLPPDDLAAGIVSDEHRLFIRLRQNTLQLVGAKRKSRSSGRQG